MKDELPPTGGGINIFRNTFKPYLPVIETGDSFNEVFQRPAEAIKPPDNEGIPQGDRILSCSGEHRQQVVFIETT